MKFKSLLTQSLLIIICLHLTHVAHGSQCETTAKNFKEALSNLQTELNWTGQSANLNSKVKAAKELVATKVKTASPGKFDDFDGKVQELKNAIKLDADNTTTWLSKIAKFQGAALSSAQNFQENKCACTLSSPAFSQAQAADSKVVTDTACIKYCDGSYKSVLNKKILYTCNFGKESIKTYPQAK